MFIEQTFQNANNRSCCLRRANSTLYGVRVQREAYPEREGDSYQLFGAHLNNPEDSRSYLLVLVIFDDDSLSFCVSFWDFFFMVPMTIH